MKKLIFLLLVFVSLNSFGQQFQWTTNKSGLFLNSEIKVVSQDKVLDKLLEYFESYKYYYDGTGYTKSGFFREFSDSNPYVGTDNKNWEEFKKSMNEINDLTITCLKNNFGGGSNMWVLIVNKERLDVISFSNEIERRGGISTYNGRVSDSKTRFIKFYNSLFE
jgi:hypothetical protein